MQRRQLLTLWRSIKTGKTPGWPPGRALEYLIIRLFEIDKADVKYPFDVRDPDNSTLEQLDGFVQANGLSALVETKDYDDTMNVGPIAKLRNQLSRRPAGLLGCLFSRGGFSQQAIKLASYMAPQGMLLWTGEEIEALICGDNIVEAMRIKHSLLLQKGLPYVDYRGEMFSGTLYRR